MQICHSNLQDVMISSSSPMIKTSFPDNTSGTSWAPRGPEATIYIRNKKFSPADPPAV